MTLKYIRKNQPVRCIFVRRDNPTFGYGSVGQVRESDGAILFTNLCGVTLVKLSDIYKPNVSKPQ